MTLLRLSAPAVLLRAMALSAILWGTDGAMAAPAAHPQDAAAMEIQKRLDNGADSVRLDGQTLDAAALRAFYQPRDWRPAWSESADTVLAVLGAAGLDGLPTGPLHYSVIAARRPATGPARLADLDLLMTDGLLRYASAMRGQRVDPRQIEDDWFIATPPFDAVTYLRDHVGDILPALQNLQPPYAGYQLLRSKLAELRAIAAAGDWPKVPFGPPLKPGATDDRIPAVRRRLMATGELARGDDASPLFDQPLVAAVQLFQRRHGLADDGVLGRQTIAAMNVSAAERARQVAVNMERWRWLPRHLESNHIVVNVPGAWLEVVDDGKAVLTMRVVVGDPDHPTPAMHAVMNSLVLNPIWRIPASIATNEILPKLKKDPGYLIANDLELVSDSFPPGSPESQGVGIAWKDMSTMPWPVRQRAGSDNALGRIKFNIPNGDDIYLHDTPNRRAFARAFRALSHGCVRVEKPDALALYVLRDKDWSEKKLETEIDDGDTRTVRLGKHLPVWLLYWTTWVDADGAVQYRDDLYGRDRRLAAALSRATRSYSIVYHNQKMTPQMVRCEGCRLP